MALGFIGESLLGRFVTSFEKVAAAAERFSFQQCKHTDVEWTSRAKHDQMEGTCRSCNARMEMGLEEIQWILKYKADLAEKEEDNRPQPSSLEVDGMVWGPAMIRSLRLTSDGWQKLAEHFCSDIVSEEQMEDNYPGNSEWSDKAWTLYQEAKKF